MIIVHTIHIYEQMFYPLKLSKQIKSIDQGHNTLTNILTNLHSNYYINLHSVQKCNHITNTAIYLN